MEQPDLEDDEREFILAGFGQWGGPAAPTNVFAKSLGLSDLDALGSEIHRLRAGVLHGSPLNASDWVRVLRLTETIVTDDRVGAGWEWTIVTPYAEAESARLLAAVRSKLGAYV